MYTVLKNGKDTGIKESNYEWAAKYWAERSRIMQCKFTLRRDA